jgi:hypothetical protein
MTRKKDLSVQKLKGFLWRPGKPVSIKAMNAAIIKCACAGAHPPAPNHSSTTPNSVVLR